MTIDMYVLGLLKFKDGKVVFKEKELDKMSKAIGKCLQEKELVLPKRKQKRMDGWRVYSLDPKKFHKKVPKKVKIRIVEFGYCHHRIILHFSLDVRRKARFFSSENLMRKEEYPLFREAREVLKEKTDEILNNCVKNKINELIPENVRGEGEAKYIYTYPFIIIKAEYKKQRMIPFSDETSTLCFEIVEPSWLPSFDKKHLMKVTIPSTILFTKKGIDETLLRDIINAIYHHCLYKKKAKDEKKLEEKKKELNEKKLEGWEKEKEEEAIEKEIFDRVLDEDLLVELWKHFLDTMGGKTTDVRIIKTMIATRWIALVAAIFSALTFILKFVIPWVRDHLLQLLIFFVS